MTEILPARYTTPIMQRTRDNSTERIMLVRVGSADSTSTMALMNELKRQYVIPDDRTVVAFINSHVHIRNVLLSAASQLQRVFGALQKPLLEVFHFGEENTDAVLVVSMPVHLTPEEALRKLDEFDECWWLNNVQQTRGDVTIDVKLI